MLDDISLSISTDGYSFETLLKSIYKNPEIAMVRELIRNALDEHQHCGQDRKVDVDFNNESFYLRDYGRGISQEDLKNLMSVILKSSKRGDKSTTGGYGLGSKTPFGFLIGTTNIAYMSSVHEGKKSVYQLSIDDTGMPKYKMLINDAPSEEHSGISYFVQITDGNGFKHCNVADILPVIYSFRGQINYIGIDYEQFIEVVSVGDDFDMVFERKPLENLNRYSVYRNEMPFGAIPTNDMHRVQCHVSDKQDHTAIINTHGSYNKYSSKPPVHFFIDGLAYKINGAWDYPVMDDVARIVCEPAIKKIQIDAMNLALEDIDYELSAENSFIAVKMESWDGIRASRSREEIEILDQTVVKESVNSKLGHGMLSPEIKVDADIFYSVVFSCYRELIDQGLLEPIPELSFHSNVSATKALIELLSQKYINLLPDGVKNHFPVWYLDIEHYSVQTILYILHTTPMVRMDNILRRHFEAYVAISDELHTYGLKGEVSSSFIHRPLNLRYKQYTLENPMNVEPPTIKAFACYNKHGTNAYAVIPSRQYKFDENEELITIDALTRNALIYDDTTLVFLKDASVMSQKLAVYMKDNNYTSAIELSVMSHAMRPVSFDKKELANNPSNHNWELVIHDLITYTLATGYTPQCASNILNFKMKRPKVVKKEDLSPIANVNANSTPRGVISIDDKRAQHFSPTYNDIFNIYDDNDIVYVHDDTNAFTPITHTDGDMTYTIVGVDNISNVSVQFQYTAPFRIDATDMPEYRNTMTVSTYASIKHSEGTKVAYIVLGSSVSDKLKSFIVGHAKTTQYDDVYNNLTLDKIECNLKYDECSHEWFMNKMVSDYFLLSIQHLVNTPSAIITAQSGNAGLNRVTSSPHVNNAVLHYLAEHKQYSFNTTEFYSMDYNIQRMKHRNMVEISFLCSLYWDDYDKYQSVIGEINRNIAMVEREIDRIGSNKIVTVMFRNLNNLMPVRIFDDNRMVRMQHVIIEEVQHILDVEKLSEST